MKYNEEKARHFGEYMKDMDQFVHQTAHFVITRHLRMLSNLKFMVDHIDFDMGYRFENYQVMNRIYTIRIRVYQAVESDSGQETDTKVYVNEREFSLPAHMLLQDAVQVISHNTRQCLKAAFMAGNMDIGWEFIPDGCNVTTLGELALHYSVGLQEEHELTQEERWAKCGCEKCEARASIKKLLDKMSSESANATGRFQTIIASFRWLVEAACDDDPSKFTEVRDHLMVVTSGDLDLSGAIENTGIPEAEVMMDSGSLMNLCIMASNYVIEAAKSAPRVN